MAMATTQRDCPIILLLTAQEAAALYALCGSITGEYTGPRQFTSKVYDTLGKVFGSSASYAFEEWQPHKLRNDCDDINYLVSKLTNQD